MHTIEVSHLAKSFGPTQAVKDVSFSVEQGEIFGLLGPNGAGKTTTIRLLLDIFRPDNGQISIFDGPMTETKKERIGYMPEERGLYQDVPLERCLVYLATLKGLSATEAHRRLEGYFDRFDLTAHKTKKIKELSKGMQQKAQIITTILHDPELIIIDEPFTALDPVNTQLVKELLRDLSKAGKTILMSTHQMHQVEELCDRILLINDGCDMLYGELEVIQRQYAGDAVIVRSPSEIPAIPGVSAAAMNGSAVKLSLEGSVSPQEILGMLVSKGVVIEQFEIATPSLDEIFIRVVEGDHSHG